MSDSIMDPKVISDYYMRSLYPSINFAKNVPVDAWGNEFEGDLVGDDHTAVYIRTANEVIVILA